jgi:hypothetical protein
MGIYVFVNFTDTSGTFDKIVFSESGVNNGNFEIDNLTAAVPEPATWAMMVAGFGLIGTFTRRRRMAAAA